MIKIIIIIDIEEYDKNPTMRENKRKKQAF